MNIQKEKEQLLKTRKANNMTKKEALTIALNTVTDTDARATIENMITQLSKPRTTSDEAKAAQSAKRKAATAAARAEMTAQVIPILRDVITKDMTAKEIYTAAADRLPADFSAPKVQNILRREMAAELVTTETKGKPNTYRLA